MLRIAVLQGGMSVERQISLMSGAHVCASLKRQGHQNVIPIDPGADFAKNLGAYEIDVAFLALHGRYGEDGCIQGLLEYAGIPYTHSGVLASAMAMDKAVSYRMFKSAGIPCPESIVAKFESTHVPEHLMEPPYVIKPVNEGSSVGIALVESLDDVVTIEPAYVGRDMLVSRYIEGRELTVAVMNNKAIGVLEAANFGKIFGYESKYSKVETQYTCPAKISGKLEERVKHYAEEAHKVLGCSGVTRVDFRYDPVEDEAYILEINTQPGLLERSMVPKIAQAHGISFDTLVDSLLKEALGH